jgi:hypothetical protein
VKDGKNYYMPNKQIQSEMAFKSGMNFQGKSIDWILTNQIGEVIPKGELYVPEYRDRCNMCGSRLICNGCSNCGGCDSKP